MSYAKKILTQATENFIDYLNRIEKVNQRADQIIVWLVGFSVGAIALLISNKLTISQIITENERVIIVFCSITVCLGIIYRIVSYLGELIKLDILLDLKSSVSSLNNTPLPFIEKFNENWSNEELINKIENILNIKFPQNLEIYDASKKEELHNILRVMYEAMEKSRNEQNNEELMKIINVLKNIVGYSYSEIIKGLKEKSNRKRYLASDWLIKGSWFLFALTNLSFLTGFVILVLKTLNINCG